MAAPRLAAAVLFLFVAVAAAIVANVQNGRMALTIRAIEGRRRSFWRPAFLIWRDYARLCPGGPLLARMWVANAVFVFGAIGVILCLR